MALSVGYITRETAQNLRRNLTLTVASILTVAVALTLAGVALLIRQGVANVSGQFEGDVEVIVYLDTDIPPAQRAAIETSLQDNPEVRKATYFDQAKAYAEAKELFKDSPTTLSILREQDVPPSFRVSPTNADFNSVVAIKNTYSEQPGVREVRSADETIKALEDLTQKINLIVFIAAFVLLVVAMLLIFNTIRTAMFARRREIEVMKLVGATNWFIRVPFMLEGLIQAILGGVVAVGTLFVYNKYLVTRLADSESLTFFRNFVVSNSDVVGTSVILLLVGAVIGSVGSGLAVGRFLDV